MKKSLMLWAVLLVGLFLVGCWESQLETDDFNKTDGDQEKAGVALGNVTQGDCKGHEKDADSEQPANAIDAIINGKIVTILHRDANLNCAAKIAFDLSTKETTIKLTERNTNSQLADCMCDVDLAVELKNLLENVIYHVEVWSADSNTMVGAVDVRLTVDPKECSSDADCGTLTDPVLDCEGAWGCINGRCEFRCGSDECSSDSECPTGYRCVFDIPTPVLEADSQEIACASDTDCPQGTVCLLADYCGQLENGGAKKCIGGGGYCSVPVDPTKGTCQAAPWDCNVEADCYAYEPYFEGVSCPGGWTCQAHSCVYVCAESQCNDDSQCPYGYHCELAIPADGTTDPTTGLIAPAYGQCVLNGQECANDQDCWNKYGEVGMDDYKGHWSCIAGTCQWDCGYYTCSSDADCEAGYRCEEYRDCQSAGYCCNGAQCVPEDVTCAADADCASGQVCENGVCVNQDCQRDETGMCLCGGSADYVCPADMGCVFDTDNCKPNETGGADCLGHCYPINTCACPEIYAPVCGTDGKTYSNECEAKCMNVLIAYDGECSTQCQSDSDCAVGLVCMDGLCVNTSCNANNDCASGQVCMNGVCINDTECVVADWSGMCACGGIAGYTCPAGMECVFDTDCDGTVPDCMGHCYTDACGCPKNYAPVCGTDGVTYDNECFAKCAGVAVASEGTCGCPPVGVYADCGPGQELQCGRDEKGCEYCQCVNVDGWCMSSGECQEGYYCSTEEGECLTPPECYDPSVGGCPDICYGRCVAKDCYCTEEYAPVCGSDGRTYVNRCYAECAGVYYYSDGVCGGLACSSDADCAQNEFCNTCPPDPNCPTCAVCGPAVCEARPVDDCESMGGKCVGFYPDSSCPEGMAAVGSDVALCSGDGAMCCVYTPNPTYCRSDADCGAGQYCENGVCVYGLD